jgi:Pyridoxamine 5'-phosphate oxidase
MQLTDVDALSVSECWDLLRTQSIVGWFCHSKALPVILPVQYYVDGHELAVCLGYFAIPERSVNDAVVAFGADAIDSTSRVGWAVQVQGTTRIPRALGVPVDCGQPAAGQIVHLAPSTIEGQRVHLCPFMSGLGNPF